MRVRSGGAGIAAVLAGLALLPGAHAGPGAPEVLVDISKTFLGTRLVSDWEGIERLPHIRWAALPPISLRNCLADGGCFSREGSVSIGGEELSVQATGARTMVFNLYVRGPSAALGDVALVQALQQVGLSGELVRCPVRGGAAGSTWYRLRGPGLSPGYLSIRPTALAGPDAGLALALGEKLPPLPPAELALYSEQCAPGAERKPVSLVKPHVQLAQTIVEVLVAAGGPAVYGWAALEDLATGIRWHSSGPMRADRTALGDPNPWMRSGLLVHSGREISVTASGSPTHVKTVLFEELGRHPRGEHLLGVIHDKGLVVQLVRCGPVYTEMTSNWYRVTGARTQPAMVRQSLSYDGDLVADTYEVRLDGTLPARDPRDRDPGVNGC